MVSRCAEKVARRYKAALRARYAEHMGELGDLLAKFRDVAAKFSRHEAGARAAQKTYEQIAKWTYAQPVEEVKALRDSIPHMGDGSPDAVWTTLSRGEYIGVQNAALAFIFATLQQMVLSPKTRKTIEAGAKFWTKKRRLVPNDKYSMEEASAKRVDLYLDMVADIAKYERVFAAVVKEGKAHISEGEGATKLKAGHFVMVNTGGFPSEVMVEKATLVEEAGHRLAKIGLQSVCYGEVLLSNKILSKSAVAAFYLPSKDEMFVRADADASKDTIRIICHELAHRFEHKFMKYRDRVGDLYETIRGHSTPTKPKIGDRLPFGAGSFTITEVTRGGIAAIDEQGAMYSFTHQKYKQLYEMMTPNAYRFVTHYAQTGGPGENFAEMVSFYAMGKLPAVQVELLTPLLE